MKKTTAIILVSVLLLLQVGCQETEPAETTAAETTIEETQPLTSEDPTAKPTATPSPTATPTPTATPVPTQIPTAVPTAAPTVTPTPKPTKAPVKETQPVEPTATTAAPTDPPPPTTVAPTYKENPDAIRDLIIQYCKDNGIWSPDATSNGEGSVTGHVGSFLSDQDYANFFIERKITGGSFVVVSVSCWIEGENINISYTKAFT